MTPITRTHDEIVNHIKHLSFNTFFGVGIGDLLVYLPFEKAKTFLKDEVTRAEFDKDTKPFTRESVIAEITGYMPFAWEKANDMRGLSAQRSIEHMDAWAYLLGDDIWEAFNAIPYRYYGKEKLIHLCEAIGLDWKQWDDEERTNG